jgi:pyruvate dehydrogenase E2 component (dihydrolipoamide acetyltransferase)
MSGEHGVNADDASLEPRYREEDASSLRKVIARRMVESKLGSPHFYLTVDVDVDRLVAWREALNAGRERKISYNDILMKAVAGLMAKHPACNASYVDGKIRFYEDVNVSLAVAVRGGLLTPTVRRCDRKSLSEISEEAAALVEKARAMKLRPREGAGGTFSISNLGMYGIEEFSAIINPPQALILAVGAIRSTPVVREGVVGIGTRMKMTLSCDHKVVDGALGAAFLSDLRSVLEDPATLDR